MTKRILFGHILLIFIFTLAACGGDREEEINDAGPVQEAVQKTVQTEPDRSIEPTVVSISEQNITVPNPTTANITANSASQADVDVGVTQESISAEEAQAIITEGLGVDSKLIRIAVQSPLSGLFAPFGIGIKNSTTLALEQASEKLEAQGFTIELLPFDDQASPALGIANAKQIVSDPSVLCMIGHLNDDVMLSTMDIYHQAGLATLSPANTHPIITERGYPEINRLIGRDDQQGVAVEAFLREKFDIETLYILHDKSAYGQGIAEVVRQAAEKNGVTLLGVDGIEETDFNAIVAMIPIANPDAIFYGALYEQAVSFFTLARDQGATSFLISPTTIHSEVGASTQIPINTYYSTLIAPVTLYPNTAQYIEAYAARFGEIPPPFSTQAYDSMNICLGAIENTVANNDGLLPSRLQVVEQIRAFTEYEGLTGKISFDENGDRMLSPYFISQVTSSDPAQWSQSEIIYTISLPAPSQIE